jgi:hypothetical protein
MSRRSGSTMGAENTNMDVQDPQLAGNCGNAAGATRARATRVRSGNNVLRERTNTVPANGQMGARKASGGDCAGAACVPLAPRAMQANTLPPPPGTQQVKAEPAPRRVVPTSRSVSNIDSRDDKEPLAVTEYVEDMYANYREQEKVSKLAGNAMTVQTQVNERMRAILVDWLVEVHFKFKLVPDTLYLTVYLIDKYLEVAQVSRQELQLVGVTALLLAAKYEEIYPPEIRDLVYITDRAYTKEQILAMEKSMLRTLQFRLTAPTIYCFLLRYLKAAHADRKIVQLSCYIAERMLQEQSMSQHLPSTIACCCIYLARKNQQRNAWSPTLEKYSMYSEADLSPCVANIKEIFSRNSELTAVSKKFMSAKFGEVSKIAIQF